MSRIAYVDGAFVPHRDASVSIEDRGLQFADSIYEVWGVRHGRLMDVDGHFKRLKRSLGELSIAPPMEEGPLRHVLEELRRRNRVRDGLIYLQVTRGTAPRDHAFPAAIRATMIATAKRIDPRLGAEKARKGVKVVTAPDIRWGRCDIKTTALTPNVLAKQKAKEAGAAEVWMLDGEGRITEGGSSNAWMVTQGGVLLTRPASDNILNGITRQSMIRLAEELQMKVEERAFTPGEARAGREAFLSSASAFVTPVVAIDGAPVGGGKPGEIALRLREAYENQSRAS